MNETPRPSTARPTLDLSGILGDPVSELATIAPDTPPPAPDDDEPLLSPEPLDLAAQAAPLEQLTPPPLRDTAPAALSLKTKALIGVAAIIGLVVAIGLFAGRTAQPPAPVATAPVTPTPAAPVPPAPGVPVAGPDAGGTAGPASVEIFHTSDSPDSQDRLEAEVAADKQPWPANMRSCEAPGLAGFDREVCTAEGAATYFRCAPDGRRWDISIAGCDRG